MEEENDELKANVELEKKISEADKEILEKRLKMTTKLLLEKELTLQQKLAQEELLHRAREIALQTEIKAFEVNITETTAERQKSEDSYKSQIKDLADRFADLENTLSSSKYKNEMLKESLKACSRTSARSAEEIYGLKKSMEWEREIQKDEIRSLKSQLDKMTNEMHEKESTLKKELAQKDAITVETKEQFIEYREEILKIAKVRQNFLKAEVAYRESERALALERSERADLHKKLEELNFKLAQYSGKSPLPRKPQAPLRQKDVSTHSSHPSTHSGHASTHSGQASTHSGQASTHSGQTSTISGHASTHSGQPSTHSVQPSTHSGQAVDEDRDRRRRDGGWTAFRRRGGYRKKSCS
ncbi:hypothetical protein SKAU_G00397930 [Synaphobranchus kaupii]|uniref:Uncharacterized protein n=1 Tax=Synaphobranchus kaupii TaxID=118154 RepID=A0A9Q1IC14_SYNKA|nr:hypothetical protein SKAU_G00397930 [Synaphobranchus kaupii]